MEPRKLFLSFVMISYVLLNWASKVKLSAWKGGPVSEVTAIQARRSEFDAETHCGGICCSP